MATGRERGLWLRRVPIMAVRSIFETDHKKKTANSLK